MEKISKRIQDFDAYQRDLCVGEVLTWPINIRVHGYNAQNNMKYLIIQTQCAILTKYCFSLSDLVLDCMSITNHCSVICHITTYYINNKYNCFPINSLSKLYYNKCFIFIKLSCAHITKDCITEYIQVNIVVLRLERMQTQR